MGGGSGFLQCRMVFIRLFKEIVCSPTNKPPYSTTSSSIIITNLFVASEKLAIILHQVYFVSFFLIFSYFLFSSSNEYVFTVLNKNKYLKL